MYHLGLVPCECSVSTPRKLDWVWGLENMDQPYLPDLRFQASAAPIPERLRTCPLSSADSHGWRTRKGLPCRTLRLVAGAHEPEGEPRSVESLELRVHPPVLCLRQFPPLPWLPEPKHVRSHRFSEPGNIPASSPLPGTSRSVRPATSHTATSRWIK